MLLSRPGVRLARFDPTWLIVGLFLLLVLPLAAFLPTWVDEEYTLRTTSHGVVAAFREATRFEIQAPLYFVVLGAVRMLGESVFVARLVSVVCAVAFVFVAREAAKRVLPPWAVTIFTAAVAFNPFTIYAALEIRLYAMAMLCSAALFVAFWDGFAARKPSGTARVAFIALAVTAAWLQYYLVFMLPAFAVALLVMGQGRRLAGFLGSCLGAGLISLPLVWILRYQLGGLDRLPSSVWGDFRRAVDPLADFALPHGWIGHEFRPLEIGAYLIVLAVLAFAMWRCRPALNPATKALVTIALVMTLEAFAVGALLHIAIIIPRQVVGQFFPVVLAAAALLASLRAPGAGTVRAVFVACYAVFSLAAIATNDLTREGDFARVGTYLGGVVAPGDIVAVYDAEAVMPLQRYYHGRAPLVPIPRPLGFHRFSLSEFALHRDADVRAALAGMPQAGHSVWLVVDHACSFKVPDFGCSHLESVVRTDFRTRTQMSFAGSTVRRLTRK